MLLCTPSVSIFVGTDLCDSKIQIPHHCHISRCSPAYVAVKYVCMYICMYLYIYYYNVEKQLTAVRLAESMMLRASPTSHFYPSHLKADLHVQASTITIPSSTHTILRGPASHDYGSTTFLPGRGSSSRVARRSNNPTAAEAASATVELESAANVVRKFYDRINRRDLASVEGLIAPNCVYEDLVFPQPFVGRKAILDFFKQFIDSISAELQFAIDDISEEDTSAVGVTWHLEWKGKPFPFSKGCSFYRLDVVDGRRQIVFGRDSVEPAVKPGETALVDTFFQRVMAIPSMYSFAFFCSKNLASLIIN